MVRLGILAAPTVAFVLSGAATAPPASEQEALISAAVVYNIARFSAWPETGPGSGPARFFEVCYDADSGMADAFATIAGKDVGGRPVRPVPVRDEAVDAKGTRGCHVYFTDGRPSEALLYAAAAYGTLTVGRAEGFLARGGAVRLRIDGKPRFSVNVTNAHAAGVRPSSKLLRLAEEVVE